MLIKAYLPAKDGQLASTLAIADESGRGAHFLASALFIWQVGQVPEAQRELVQSTTFKNATIATEDQGALDLLLQDIGQCGQLLKQSRSRHTKRVLMRARGGPVIFLDRCFLEWGVHHFHVHPSARGRDLLVYAAFDDTHAYLLAVGGHSTLNDAILIDAMAEVCPHILTVLNGVTGDSFTPEQLSNLRRKNVSSAIGSAHGAVVPRVPCSAAGLPLQVITNVDYELACLDGLQSVLDDPATEQYRSIQQALETAEPLMLTIVPRESNFAGSIAFRDSESGKELHLNYRT